MPEIHELRIKSASEIKRNLISAQLSDSAGVIVRGKNCFVVAIQAKNILEIERWIEISGVYLGILGLSGSENGRRSLEFMVEGLESFLKSTFSIRDLNFFIIQDFTCRFLSESLYNTKSEQPLGLELVLIRVDNEERVMNFSVVNFAGESQSFKDGFKVFGCTDPAKRKELEGYFQKQDLKEMPLKELMSLTGKALAGFGGNFAAKSFSIVSGETKKPKNKKGSKKNKK